MSLFSNRVYAGHVNVKLLGRVISMLYIETEPVATDFRLC